MKNDFDILNEVTIDFSEYDDLSLNDIEKQEMKNRVKNKIKTKERFLNKKVIASIISLMLIGGISLTNQKVFASIKTLIFGSSVESYFNRPEGTIYDYKSVIGKTVTDKDISVTLNDVAFDTDGIVVSTTINTSKVNVNAQDIFPVLYLYIDGKMAHQNNSMSTLLDNNRGANFCINFNIDDLDLTKSHKITYKLEQIDIMNETVFFGNWNFEFNADGKSISDRIKIIPFEKDIQLSDDVKIKLHKVTISPLSFKATFAIYGETNKYVRLYAEDDLGTKYKIPDEGGLDECHIQFSPNINAKKIKLIPNLRGQLMYDKAIEIDLENLKNTLP